MEGTLTATSQINIYLKSDPTILMTLKSSKLLICVCQKKYIYMYVCGCVYVCVYVYIYIYMIHPFEERHIDLNSVYFLYIGSRVRILYAIGLPWWSNG